MLQKKTEASLATFSSKNNVAGSFHLLIYQSDSTLPPNIAHFQALVPLVHNTQKNTNLFGYSSWIYKAISSHDGKAYCLRRLQGEIFGYKAVQFVLSGMANTYFHRLSVDKRCDQRKGDTIHPAKLETGA